MRNIVSFFLVLVGFSQARAFTLEPSVSMTALNTYHVSNIDAEYDLSGALIRVEALFDFGDMAELYDSKFFWGAGFGYGSFKGDLENASMASASLAASAKFDAYLPYLILGYSTTDFVIKLMATPYIQLREKEGVTDGDEKYGYGGGLEVGYKLYEYLSIHLGYHYYMFGKGKNSSTGLSGSLANDVDLKFVTAGVSFPFSFSGMSPYGGSSRSSRGRY